MKFSEYREIELQKPAEFAAAQDELLRCHLGYCAEFSPFYREKLKRQGIVWRDITLKNITDLPFTTKSDLENRNDDFLAVMPERVVDIVFSSGTTGMPTRIAYTENDLVRLAYNEHQSLAATGMSAADTVLLTCTMDRCFVAGLAYFMGCRSLGAATIRNGHGTMDGHMEIIRRVAPTVIIGVPSFLVKLGQYLKSSGVNPRETSVRKLICIGEPVRGYDLQMQPAGKALCDLWGASIYSTYASSETVTTFCECEKERGGHLHPELGIVEIIDENGKSLPPGEVGEIVITPLAVEGMPFIRFQTGDLGFLIDEPCGCGRNSPRLSPILGRKKQMIKFKGTTLYPQAIGAALATIPAVVEHYIEVCRKDHFSDQLTIHVALDDPGCDAERIAERLQSRLRVKPEVKVEPFDQIKKRVFLPEYRKPMRFFDRRNI